MLPALGEDPVGDGTVELKNRSWRLRVPDDLDASTDVRPTSSASFITRPLGLAWLSVIVAKGLERRDGRASAPH